MLNLAPEVLQVNREGLIGDEAAGALVAQERREIVSVYAEIRALAWIGVMLIASGVGVIVSKNLDRIGPVAIAIALGSASAVCYAYAGVRRQRRRSGVLDEYVLLLGALILSADLGYIEHQFHLLGPQWPRHFLVLAAIHGVTAYLFDSAALLSLSIAALASWLGIERNVDTFFTDKVDTAGRAFVCALIVSVWRFAHVSFRAKRGIPRLTGSFAVSAAQDDTKAFLRVFDHFILNLALWGGLILTFNDDTQHLGFLVTVALACVTIAYGFRQREESFVIYGYVYGVIAFEYELFQIVHDEVLRLLFLTVSMGVVVAGLYLLHDRFKRKKA